MCTKPLLLTARMGRSVVDDEGLVVSRRVVDVLDRVLGVGRTGELADDDGSGSRRGGDDRSRLQNARVLPERNLLRGLGGNLGNRVGDGGRFGVLGHENSFL